jgi:DNA-binding response OmpR family regulator
MFNGKPQILCIDDEPNNLKLLEAVLVPRGYEVIKEENGNEALQRIMENRIDLVLLDVMMPGTDGLKVCKMIKNDERYRSIPVIMVTALNSKEDRIKGIEAGADEFLSKPFDQGEVIARIKMLLQMKDLNDGLNYAYTLINNLASFGGEIVQTFNPLNFDFMSKIDSIVNQIIRKASDAIEKPQIMFVGIINERNNWQWYQYEAIFNELKRMLLSLSK